MDSIEALRYCIAPLEMTESEFRTVGHRVIEGIAELLCSLPEQGAADKDLLEEAATLLFEHSTSNGHPPFWSVITSSAALIGALADLLAAAVNPNAGGWALAPIATEMEAQTIRSLPIKLLDIVSVQSVLLDKLRCPTPQISPFWHHLNEHKIDALRTNFASARGQSMGKATTCGFSHSFAPAF